ncbi:hypothetical protein Tco_1299136, partial [Tanacetum coccineum]
FDELAQAYGKLAIQSTTPSDSIEPSGTKDVEIAGVLMLGGKGIYVKHFHLYR